MADSFSDSAMRPTAPASAATLTPMSPPVARVLLADIDMATLKAVAVTLRQEGRVSVTAADGATALALLTDGAFDLVISDVRVEANGESLLATARRIAPHTLRIAVTAYATLDSALQALRAGAYNYLVKPLDVDELRLAVSQALERLQLERELAARVQELEQAQRDLLAANSRLQEQVDIDLSSQRRRDLEPRVEVADRFVGERKVHRADLACDRRSEKLRLANHLDRAPGADPHYV